MKGRYALDDTYVNVLKEHSRNELRRLEGLYKMKRAEALDRAKKAVSERNASYGEPEDNFLRIANRWNAHLMNLGLFADGEDATEVGLQPSDVAIMLADVKLARAANDPTKADNWVDLAGYAACGAEVSDTIDVEDITHIPLKGFVNECERPRLKVGDIVECIDAGRSGGYYTVGRRYEVSRVAPDPKHGQYVECHDVGTGLFARHFKLVHRS